VTAVAVVAMLAVPGTALTSTSGRSIRTAPTRWTIRPSTSTPTGSRSNTTAMTTTT